jgi:hypothetical protein
MKYAWEHGFIDLKLFSHVFLVLLPSLGVWRGRLHVLGKLGYQVAGRYPKFKFYVWEVLEIVRGCQVYQLQVRCTGCTGVPTKFQDVSQSTTCCPEWFPMSSSGARARRVTRRPGGTCGSRGIKVGL